MKKIRKPHLSVIIPVYNEFRRIDNLKKILKFFSSKKFNSEIIIVNDGSTDDTLAKIETLLLNKSFKNINTKIISYEDNRGKGYAIKRGMLGSNGKFKLFMDIDLSTPLSTFKTFEKYINKYPVIIASRKMLGSKLLTRQPIVREYMGKGFTMLSNTILQTKISDFTCGYKLFSETASKKIFSKQKIDRWGFDSEILFICTRLGYRIKEVPVTWKNDSNSKVRFPHDFVTSLVDLIKIRRLHT